jgi:hypothetical protein
MKKVTVFETLQFDYRVALEVRPVYNLEEGTEQMKKREGRIYR